MCGQKSASEQLDLFAKPAEEPESIEAEESSAKQSVLDQISDLYLADKTPLEVMQLVANWQEDLKDENN